MKLCSPQLTSFSVCILKYIGQHAPLVIILEIFDLGLYRVSEKCKNGATSIVTLRNPDTTQFFRFTLPVLSACSQATFGKVLSVPVEFALLGGIQVNIRFSCSSPLKVICVSIILE